MRIKRLGLTFSTVHAGIALVTVLAAAFEVAPAHAQVSDTERAAARDLFKQGDTLQRAGHFAEALDKFQRAQQVYAAPTNVLRIAECDAALGKLVESTEAYREVLRTPLPPSAPAAFQSAVDQAKAELSQVEPRVPKLVVQVQPAGVPSPQMQIDGQSVPGALIGEPMLLNTGSHKIAVLAPGYASTELQVELKEHDSKTVALTLNAISGVTYAPAAPGPAVAVQGTASLTSPPPAPASTGETPPPPPTVAGPDEVGPPQRKSNFGLLVGLHLGAQFAGGNVPLPSGEAVPAGDVGSSGFAFGIDGGVRLGHHFYLGLTLNRASLNNGNAAALNYDKTSSSTTLFGVVGAFIGNTDHTSFYGELGFGERWFDVKTELGGKTESQLFDNPEFDLGVGVWIPIGHVVRLLPKFSLGLGSIPSSFGVNDYTSFVAFAMLGLQGMYNIDF